MDTITKLIRQRDRTLSIAAFSFVIWQGGQLLQDLAGEQGWAGSQLDLAILFTILGGAIGWVLASLMFLTYASRVSREKAQPIIQDELYCRQQRMSVRAGYMALIASIAALLAADLVIEFSAGIAIRALLIIGIAVPLVTFVLLSAGSGGDEE